MPHLELSPQQVNLLVDVFLLGNEVQASEETAAVVRLIKQVRPAECGLAVVESWQLIRAGRLAQARQLLEDADAATPSQPMLKALLALCLLSQNDSLWQSYLDELRFMQADDEVQAMVRTLEAFSQDNVLLN